MLASSIKPILFTAFASALPAIGGTLALPDSPAFANLSSVTNTDIRSMMDVWDGLTPGHHNVFALTGTVHTVLTSIRAPSSAPCFVIDDGELLLSVFNETRPPVDLHPGDRIVAHGIFGLKKCAYGNEPYAVADEIHVLGAGAAVQPVQRKLQDLSSVRASCDSFSSRPAGAPDFAMWLRRLPRPCALFAANDRIAKVAADVCRVSGIRVPQEIAILGVDDEKMVCNFTSPTLSSIRPSAGRPSPFFPPS